MSKMPTKPRGSEKRLFSLTYSQIAAWVGLESRSVQQYASRGEFDQRDIESVLTWVNGRRAALGLPLIGMPECFTRADYDRAAELIGVPPEVLRSGTWAASSDHPETENTRQETTAKQTGPQVTEQTADTPGSDG